MQTGPYLAVPGHEADRGAVEVRAEDEGRAGVRTRPLERRDVHPVRLQLEADRLHAAEQAQRADALASLCIEGALSFCTSIWCTYGYPP